jgi:SulP family sulfate permease
MQRLASHASAIRVFELDGDLFFGVADQLDSRLRENCHGVETAVLDWSRVRHIDSSVAQSIAKFERHALAHGTSVFHAGTSALGGNVGLELQTHLPGAQLAPDLDRALEQAESLILQRHAGAGDAPGETMILAATTLFQGLSERERALLDASMQPKLFFAGQTLMKAGEPSDELMLLLHGSASVQVPSPDGSNIRLAGVRRGATVGEIGFLDGAPRSASVVAQEDVLVAILGRSTFNALCDSEPRMMQRLLANIALEVAARLRTTNHLAIARQGNQ